MQLFDLMIRNCCKKNKKWNMIWIVHDFSGYINFFYFALLCYKMFIIKNVSNFLSMKVCKWDIKLWLFKFNIQSIFNNLFIIYDTKVKLFFKLFFTFFYMHKRKYCFRKKFFSFFWRIYTFWPWIWFDYSKFFYSVYNLLYTMYDITIYSIISFMK